MEGKDKNLKGKEKYIKDNETNNEVRKKNIEGKE